MFKEIFEEPLTEMANINDKKHHLGSEIIVNIFQGDKNTHGPRVKIFKRKNSNDYITLVINRKTKEINYVGDISKWYKGNLKKQAELFTYKNASNLIALYDDKDLSIDDFEWE